MTHESTNSVSVALDRAVRRATSSRPVWVSKPAQKMSAAARKIARVLAECVDIAREEPTPAHTFTRGDVLRFARRPAAIYVVTKVKDSCVIARHLSAHGLGNPEIGVVVGEKRVMFLGADPRTATYADLFVTNAERVALFRPGR